MEGIKEKMDYEKAYRTSVSQYNEIIELYRKLFATNLGKQLNSSMSWKFRKGRL